MSDAADMYYKQQLVHKQQLLSQNEPELQNRILFLESRMAQLERMVNLLTNQHTIVDPQMISVKKDSENDYIDIPFQDLEMDKFYLVNYLGESYAVRKISQDHLAFYDVIE